MQLEAIEGFLSGEVNRCDLGLKMTTLAPLEKVSWRRQSGGWEPVKGYHSGLSEKVCGWNPNLGSG